MNYVIVVFGILANASASLLLKLATMPPRVMPNLANPLAALSNWPLWLGLFLYGTTFLLYITALSRLPLNVAHPTMTAGAIALVSIFSVTILHEHFYWTTAGGILCILAGVVLLSIHNA